VTKMPLLFVLVLSRRAVLAGGLTNPVLVVASRAVVARDTTRAVVLANRAVGALGGGEARVLAVVAVEALQGVVSIGVLARDAVSAGRQAAVAVAFVNVPAAGVALVQVLVGATLAVAFTKLAAADVVAVGEVAVERAGSLLDRLEEAHDTGGAVLAVQPLVGVAVSVLAWDASRGWGRCRARGRAGSRIRGRTGSRMLGRLRCRVRRRARSRARRGVGSRMRSRDCRAHATTDQGRGPFALRTAVANVVCFFVLVFAFGTVVTVASGAKPIRELADWASFAHASRTFMVSTYLALGAKCGCDTGVTTVGAHSAHIGVVRRAIFSLGALNALGAMTSVNIPVTGIALVQLIIGATLAITFA
jgi:hypothetical protein